MSNPVIEQKIIPKHLDLFCRADGRIILFLILYKNNLIKEKYLMHT